MFFKNDRTKLIQMLKTVSDMPRTRGGTTFFGWCVLENNGLIIGFKESDYLLGELDFFNKEMTMKERFIEEFYGRVTNEKKLLELLSDSGKNKHTEIVKGSDYVRVLSSEFSYCLQMLACLDKQSVRTNIRRDCYEILSSSLYFRLPKR